MGNSDRHTGQRPSPHRRAMNTATIHRHQILLQRSLESGVSRPISRSTGRSAWLWRAVKLYAAPNESYGTDRARAYRAGMSRSARDSRCASASARAAASRTEWSGWSQRACALAGVEAPCRPHRRGECRYRQAARPSARSAGRRRRPTQLRRGGRPIQNCSRRLGENDCSDRYREPRKQPCYRACASCPRDLSNARAAT